jgi:hypothetical protein
MAKYSDIKGFTVQTLSTDTVASQQAGGSWSSGGNLPGGRDETTGGGTLTAGIQFGGYDHPSYKPETFEYNGTAWTEGGDMSNARSNFGGLGTQTAALAVGGQNPGLSPYPFNGSEEYNGSSWTTGGTLPGGFDGNYGCTGTQTAGLQIGGTKSPNTKQVKTLSYNGTAWSDTGHDVPTAVDRNGATGISTAAMSGGGRAPSATNAFFIYNGSSWTAITNYPQSGYHFQLQGPYTDVIASGGYPLNTNANWWDGTSWTTAPSMSNNHGQAAKANSTAGATSGDGFVAGADPSGLNGTEHWNSAPSVFVQQVEGQLFFNSTANAFKETISDAATGTWASVANLNVASSQGSTGAGKSNSAALEIGGYFNPPLQYYATVEQFDGSSWTEIADLNEGRSYGAGGGSITSALIAGGTDGTNLATTESWDGSSWTETGDFNNARQVVAGAIPSNADGIAMGGYDGSYRAYVETWNGSTWTETTDLNAAAGYNTGSGTSTAALSFGGEPTPRDRVESWNGSSWTEVAEINTARAQGGSSGEGTNTSTIYFGGEPPQSAKTELWNGSSWTEIADLATARTGTGGAGVATSAIAIGGNPGSPPYALAEAFTAALTNKTITAS